MPFRYWKLSQRFPDQERVGEPELEKHLISVALVRLIEKAIRLNLTESEFLGQCREMWVTITAIEMPSLRLTPVSVDLNLRVMGDKSPKAMQKHAAQKQVKVDAARQEKNKAASAKQVQNTKK